MWFHQTWLSFVFVSQPIGPTDGVRCYLWIIYAVSSENVSMRATAVYLSNNLIIVCWEPSPPYAGRTKRADGSPMLIPSLSRFLQHHIHKLGKRRPAENPVVITVCSRLDLVKVGSKEAVQGVPAIDSQSIIWDSHLTTMKIRLELIIWFSWAWSCFG